MEQDGICPSYIMGVKCLWAYRRIDTDKCVAALKQAETITR